MGRKRLSTSFRFYIEENGEKVFMIGHNPVTFKKGYNGYVVKSETKASEILKKAKEVDDTVKLLREELNMKKQEKVKTEIIDDVFDDTDDSGPRIDPEELFKKGLNETCKKCKKKCKQHMFATLYHLDKDSNIREGCNEFIEK